MGMKKNFKNQKNNLLKFNGVNISMWWIDSHFFLWNLIQEGEHLEVIVPMGSYRPGVGQYF